MPLPDLLPFDGDWDAYVERVYQCFLDNVVTPKHRLDGKRVSCKYVPATNGKHYGFWHLISEGPVEEERTPDIRRMERVPWIRWILENHDSDDSISTWENQRGRAKNRLFLIEQERYLLILECRRDYFMLKTTYWLTEQRLRKNIKERDAYLRSRK